MEFLSNAGLLCSKKTNLFHAVCYYVFGWTITLRTSFTKLMQTCEMNEQQHWLRLYCFQYLSLINFVFSCNFHYISILSELVKTIFYSGKHGKCICHPHLTRPTKQKVGETCCRVELLDYNLLVWSSNNLICHYVNTNSIKIML